MTTGSRASGVPAPALSGEGERLWREVENVFGDPARHDRFVDHCAKTGALPSAARRYRDWMAAHPADTTAPKMIQRITFLALQPLAVRAPAKAPLTRSKWFVVSLLAAAAGGAVAGVWLGR